MSKSRKSLAALGVAATTVFPAGLAFAAGGHLPSPGGPRVLRASLAGHASVAREMRVFAAESRRARARRRARTIAGMPPILHRIAECESHGDPHAIGGGGAYRGAFQFSRSTWASVGGRGDPAAAALDEQYRRAAILLARSGTGQWPVCGA